VELRGFEPLTVSVGRVSMSSPKDVTFTSIAVPVVLGQRIDRPSSASTPEPGVRHSLCGTNRDCLTSW